MVCYGYDTGVASFLVGSSLKGSELMIMIVLVYVDRIFKFRK